MSQMIGLAGSLIRFRSYVRPAAWGVIAAGLLTVATAVVPSLAPVGVISFLLMTVGALALLVSGLIGLGRTALVGTGVTAAGWLLLVIGVAVETLVGGSADALFFTIGLVAALAGLITTGVAAIQAKKWGSWQRFTPLAAAALLVVLVVLVATIKAGSAASYLGWWGLSFIALGYAMLKPE